MSTTEWEQQAGMTGDIDSDNVQDLVEQAETSEDNAAASATAAASSATSASTSANAASNSASSASTSAATATTKASEASTSATNAATSATAAQTAQTAAETAETNAETAQTAAEAAETAAEAAKNAALGAQIDAETAETNAAASATSAASSATTATTQATNASTSATAAAASATAASASETAASASETAAAASETAAAASESAAAASESAAAASESAASTSATNAANSASSASTSASQAATSATSAAASAASAAATYDAFDDRYLGAKSSDPTLDNDGNALIAGALYFNTTASEMRTYDGSLWIAASSASIETMDKFKYTATASQTAFTGLDDAGNTMALNVGAEIVTLNGVVLEQGTDYTATSDTITLTSGAAASDELNIYAFGNFTVADTVSKSSGGTFDSQVNFASGIDVTGTVTADGLTVDGKTLLSSTGETTPNTTATLELKDYVSTSIALTQSYSSSVYSTIGSNFGGTLSLKAGTGTATSEVLMFTNNKKGFWLDNTNDISFYEDTGTTPKFFWDASAERLGLGTTSPKGTLDVAGDASLRLSNGESSADTEYASIGVINPYASSSVITSKIGFETGSSGSGYNEGQITFSTAPSYNNLTERMRIDEDGRVGIGTNSPNRNLHIAGNAAYAKFDDTTNGATFTVGSNASGFIVYDDDAASYRMVIDSSGNVGIGTSSPAKNLHVYNATINRPALVESGDQAALIEFKDNSTSNPPAVGAITDALIFQTGSSSSERMRIDSSGNVGIGTSSPWEKLSLPFNAGLSFGSSAYPITISRSAAGQLITTIADGYDSSDTRIDFVMRSGSASENTALSIMGSGRVGIGTSSPARPLHVYNASESNLRLQGGSDYAEIRVKDADNALSMHFNGSERMRIDSSGNLLVGATSQVSGETISILKSSSNSAAILSKPSTNTAYYAYVIRNYSNTTVGSIYTNGSTTAFNTSSDYRLKEDWQPMSGSIERVKALNPVNFAWKSSGERVDGFLAHEAQAVVPEAVVGTKDAVDADGNPDYQGIDQSKLVPLLTSALQEAIAEIDSLKARVAALEN
jgi:hypothetical protein